MNKFARIVPVSAARRAAVVGLLASAGSSFAAGVDFSSLTAAVDLSTVGVAVLAIAALVMVVNVTSYGARRVLRFIRG